jgi:hypothetical protein
MRLNLPPERPRRDLEEAELVDQFGLTWLLLTVLVQAGVVKKTGEVRTRRLSTRYLVRDQGGGEYRLVTERTDPQTGRPVAYTVNRWGCDCMDAQVRGRERRCKHISALEAAGLLPGVAKGPVFQDAAPVRAAESEERSTGNERDRQEPEGKTSGV